jgi:hypothetical protein
MEKKFTQKIVEYTYDKNEKRVDRQENQQLIS